MKTRIAGLLLFACAAFAQNADTVFYNGRILTVDSQFRIADSLAIRADRILAVGTREEVNKAAGASARRVDLKGRTVLPGLMDSHVHASDAAMYEYDHPVPDMETIADVLKYLKSRAAVAKPGDWINGRGWSQSMWPDGGAFPTAADLDSVAPNNPVYLRARSGHA